MFINGFHSGLSGLARLNDRQFGHHLYEGGHLGALRMDETLQMDETTEIEKDPALGALEVLSEVAASGAEDLNSLQSDLANMRRLRIEGWSWQRIVFSDNSASPLSVGTSVLANLGQAIGAFRRALASTLRTEGMRVTEIASLFEVSRQRVSALVRPKRPE
jgi:hypothetical protein